MLPHSAAAVSVAGIDWPQARQELVPENGPTLQELPQRMTAEEELRRHEIGKDFVRTAAPVGPVRNIAEFEPQQGVLVRYPLGIPIDLVTDMSHHTTVYTIVANNGHKNQAISAYSGAGANMDNCEFIVADNDSYWTRDYGPWFIIDGNQEMAVVDFIYNRPRPKDNEIPAVMAGYLDLPLYAMDVVHSGGNFMSDGHGVAVSTALVYEENNYDTQHVLQQAEDFLGIHTYHIVNDVLEEYIQHIDTWAKFLDVDKILIAEVPSTDPRYTAYEAVAGFFAQQTSSYGSPLEVIRIYTPNDEPYTNSLILNDRVYVPLTGGAYDQQAIDTYEAAMPGYTILGFEGEWESTDALHCRVKDIADLQMLHISHIPIHGEHLYQESFLIEAEIIAYSGADLLSEDLLLHYRADDGDFQQSTLTHDTGNTYIASLPVAPENTQISYYLSAADASGRSENWPLIGEAGARTFYIVGCYSPKELSVSNISNDGATLSWTAGGSESQWNIEAGLPGFAPGQDEAETGIEGMEENTWTVTGLDAFTTYEFYVQSVCDDENTGSWTGPMQFSTGCGIVTSLPFVENFDDSDELPQCWEIVDHEGNGQVWQFGTHNSGLTGTTGNYAYIDSDGYGWGNSQNADLVTPQINLSDYENVSLSFTHYFRQWLSNSTASLSYSIDNGNSWILIEEWTSTTSNPAYFSQTIPALAGEAEVRFMWNYSGTWAYSWNIDDIEITGTLPIVCDPIDSYPFAEIFNSASMPDCWTIETTSAGHSWQLADQFTVGDGATTINPQEGSHFFYCPWTDTEDQDELLILPTFDFSAMGELSFSFWFNGSYHWSVEQGHCDLDVVVSLDEGQTWESVWNNQDHPEFTNTDINYVWLHTQLDLSDFAGEEEVMLAFRYYGTDGAPFAIDNVLLEGVEIPMEDFPFILVIEGPTTSRPGKLSGDYTLKLLDENNEALAAPVKMNFELQACTDNLNFIPPVTSINKGKSQTTFKFMCNEQDSDSFRTITAMFSHFGSPGGKGCGKGSEIPASIGDVRNKGDEVYATYQVEITDAWVWIAREDAGGSGDWFDAFNWNRGDEASSPQADARVILRQHHADINPRINNDAMVELGIVEVDDNMSITVEPGSALTINDLSKNGRSEGEGYGPVLRLETYDHKSGSFIHYNEIQASVTRFFTGGSKSSEMNWYQLSSPVVSQAVDQGENSFVDGGAIYSWYEPAQQWVSFLDNEHWPSWGEVNAHQDEFLPMRGYMASFEGDVHRQFEGQLNVGDYSLHLMRYAHPDDPYVGFNLIGNPYASYIDLQSKDGWQGLEDLESPSVWVWNNEAGQYAVYDIQSDQGTFQMDRHLPPLQGFWVRAANHGQLLVIKPEARNHNGMGEEGDKGTKPNAQPWLSLWVEAKHTGYRDHALMGFGHPSAGGGVDKMFSFLEEVPSLYVDDGESAYSISYHGTPETEAPISLHFLAGHQGEYSMVPEDTGDFDILILEDLLTGQMHDLSRGEPYVFYADPSDMPARFKLHVGSNGDDHVTHVNEPGQDQGAMHAWSHGRTLHVETTHERTRLEVIDLQGRIIMEEALQGPGRHQLHHALGTGVFILRLQGGDQQRSIRVVTGQ